MPVTLVNLDRVAMTDVVARFADALARHRDGINQLNVYPVPDGDTGTNMSLTLRSVVEAVEEAAPSTMAELCRALAHGSLMGARGNSGVILSQIMRGMCEVLVEHETVGAEALADSLSAGAKAAYGAVMRPVEGTILTVMRELAAAAAEAANEGDLLKVVEAAYRGGHEALARTPDLLPVLRDAGVVDAGGTGVLLLCDALLHVIDGRPMPEPLLHAAPNVDPFAGMGKPREGVASLRYEVMFFLAAPDDTMEVFKQAWMDAGDSIVVVGGDGLYNCHIHTNDIGAAIEAGVIAGRPSKIRVTDLFEEMEEREWVLAANAAAPAADAEHVTTGVVAVGVGAGIATLFRSLGVHEIVTGGQSMNPSTAELLAAVEACPAVGVVILPNNKNIIPVAEQVGSHTTKIVRVIPTRNVAEALASLVDYDPEADVVENAAAMGTAAAAVVAGELTQAVRDAASPAGPVRTGDYIGLARDGIVSVSISLVEAATTLLDRLLDDDHEIVTMIAGEDATEDMTREIAAWLNAAHPDVDVEVHQGDQPLYTYYFGVE